MTPAESLRQTASLLPRDQYQRAKSLRRMAESFEKTDAMFSRILGLYRVRGASTELADWAKEGSDATVFHVALARKPEGETFQAALNNLAGVVVDRCPGKNVIDVCHGVFEYCAGIAWCCFVRVE